MIQTYHFEGEKPFQFDDSKTVKELIEYAFELLGYYEPAGMNIVTIFQCHHSKSNYGWLTTDTSRICSEEIENKDELCFAYYKPDTFYFAEGGWGHHMLQLGNHPALNMPVCLHIQFENFDNTVVINGKYRFIDVVEYLKQTEYISQHVQSLEIIAIGKHFPNSYCINLKDELFYLKLTEFEQKIEKYTEQLLAKSEVFTCYLKFVLK